MQQYFTIDSGSRTLTVFHTDDMVSFDVEHHGGFKIDDTELQKFLESEEEEELTVTENPAEQHTELAEKHPKFYPDEDQFRGTITKTDAGGLQIYIQGGLGEITLTLTPEQTETLEESITIGTVERYSNGQYPVESVSRDGERDRGSHN